MTFPTGSVFEDELLTVKKYFEKWTASERAVAVCAMLKQFQYPALQFVQSKIEALNAQNSDSEKVKFMERKSNDRSYINELCKTYKSMTTTSNDVPGSNNNNINNNNKDSTFFESDRLIDNSTMNYNNNNTNYSNNNVNCSSLMANVADQFSTKEEILAEILNCILMLKIGNDDVIQEYLGLIIFLLHDTQNYNVNYEIVKQVMSILVSHPALSSDNLRIVKDYTDRVGRIIKDRDTNWQAITPPVHASHHKTSITTLYASMPSVVSERELFDTQSDYIEADNGSLGRSSVGGSDYFITNIGLPCNQCHSNTDDDAYNYYKSADDKNISFSKNGTEINDFNLDQDPPTSQFHRNLNHLFDYSSKTRRSNSLTMGGLKLYDQFLGVNVTSSTENLSHLHKQKERSFSLSTENPRLMKMGSGSETRLDDLKPNYQAFQSQHTGMKFVGFWLKKLRLHKYCGAFEDMTFDKMMLINEEYLERLGITQGARTKMINSIQKLKERYARLTQTECDLKNGQMPIEAATQLLTEIADTPMKPIYIYDKNNVAAQFLNVLTLVCDMLKSKVIEQQDEEMINQLTEIFDMVQLHNSEPFQSHANQVKELRYEVDTIKRQFPPHNHYSRNGTGPVNGGNANKARWTSFAKPNRGERTHISENKPNRKNSNPMANINYVAAQQVQKSQTHGSKPKPTQQRMCRPTEMSHTQTSGRINKTGNNPEGKSSSYPNCSSSNTNNGSRSNGQQYASVNNQNANPQLHHSYHRHSVSNLSTMATMAKTTVTITPAAPIPQHQKTSSCVGLHLSPVPASHLSGGGGGGGSSYSSSAITPIASTIISSGDYCLSCDNGGGRQFSLDWTADSGRAHSTGGSSSYPKQASNIHLLGDISPYRQLESLSLQMTEQAIN